MDGKPLTRSHGAPLRLVMPSMYGYKGVKWVRELRFDSDPDARLLGAARLRHRRLGRPVERLWLDRASRASGAAERAAHWLLAVTFFVMLFTGLLPERLGVRGHPRPAHRQGLAPLERDRARGRAASLVTLLGDRRALARSAREIDRFDADDGRWLRGAPRRLLNGRPAPPQGRFNAGQKLNAALIGGLMLAMYVTGGLLWYGERDTTYRFAGTVMVHDWAHADPDAARRRPPLPRGAAPGDAPRAARHDARRRRRGRGRASTTRSGSSPSTRRGARATRHARLS